MKLFPSKSSNSRILVPSNLVLFSLALGLIFTGAVFGSSSQLGSIAIQQTPKERNLVSARRDDNESRDTDGTLKQLSPAEHLRRANVYMLNREFDEAREHWQALIKYYPQSPSVPEAMFGIGRSYFQSRRYSDAFDTFSQLANTYPSTKEGREGLNFSASSLLRLGRPSDAVARFIEYINRFPNGERIDTAHLNVIDSLREAGRPTEAISWITRTAQRFAGTATETNAIFARLRLDIAEKDWDHALVTADDLRRRSFQKGVLTTGAEVAYLRAYSLEQAGRRADAINAYLSIPDGLNSYYGGLATERLNGLADQRTRGLASERTENVRSQAEAAGDSFPAPYKQSILRAAKARKLDPRFILAIIRQESVFKPLAKSPAGARGLLQLTIDAAQKYAPGAGLNALRESELYRPETSIVVGSEYIAHLVSLFPNMLEPVAASYNGGEDNVARWVKRARHKDPGVFTSEVGFEETKAYVQKVMSNYRAYRQLYTADLVLR
jgi:peptidoglycan lytic transglycosylase